MTDQIEIQTTARRQSIRLRFDWQEDRWAHHLIVPSELLETEIMSSVEGTPDQTWPPSAPLQDVSRHALEQGEAILCVGMAGKSHWSASFSAQAHGQTCQIKADLACLQKAIAPNAQLGSTYLLDQNLSVTSTSRDRVELLLDNQDVVEIEALSGEGFDSSFELDDRTLTIKPIETSANPKVATRWGFTILVR